MLKKKEKRVSWYGPVKEVNVLLLLLLLCPYELNAVYALSRRCTDFEVLLVVDTAVLREFKDRKLPLILWLVGDASGRSTKEGRRKITCARRYFIAHSYLYGNLEILHMCI